MYVSKTEKTDRDFSYSAPVYTPLRSVLHITASSVFACKGTRSSITVPMLMHSDKAVGIADGAYVRTLHENKSWDVPY
jgi:hypothetical protein